MLLPEKELSSSPDVTIRFQAIDELTENSSHDGAKYKHSRHNQLLLQWNWIGKYLITAGREVLLDPISAQQLESIRLPILGTIMAIILQQRGCTVLHGSAVNLQGRAVLFLGRKGEGKSTLAGWLNQQGCPLLSDDVCALNEGPDCSLSLRPAFPRIRLNPDILEHWNDDPKRYPQVHPKVVKRIRPVPNFCKLPIPAGAICVLTSGDTLQLKRLRGMAAMQEVLSHMMIHRFPENQPKALQKQLFAQAATVVQTLPVYRLTRPRDLDLLAETTPLIQQMVDNTLR